MGDVTSGMASTVIQLYLKPILDCFIHGSSSVRQSAFRVTQLILQQGLVRFFFWIFWVLRRQYVRWWTVVFMTIFVHSRFIRCKSSPTWYVSVPTKNEYRMLLINNCKKSKRNTLASSTWRLCKAFDSHSSCSYSWKAHLKKTLLPSQHPGVYWSIPVSATLGSSEWDPY